VSIIENGELFLTQKKLIAKKVFPGVYHCFALSDDHQLFAWGDNTYGQTGCKKGLRALTPYTVKIDDLARGEYPYEVVCGLKHSLCLTNQGRVFVTGSNDRGQLGLNQNSDLDSFALLSLPELFDNEVVVLIKAGYEHSIIFTSSGRIFTWGDNRNHQLGIDNANQMLPRPQLLELPLDANEWITDLATGWNHNIVLTSEHRIMGWGENQFGQLGPRKTKLPSVLTLMQLYHDEFPEKIIATCNQTMIIMNTHRYFACGNNEGFRLGSKQKLNIFPKFTIDHIYTDGDYRCMPRFKQTLWQRLFKPQIRRKEYLTMLTSNVKVTIGVTNLGLVYVWGTVNGFKSLIKHNLLFFLRRLIHFPYALFNFRKPLAVRLPNLLSDEKINQVQCTRDSCFFLSNQGRVYAIHSSFGWDPNNYLEQNLVSSLGLMHQPDIDYSKKKGWLPLNHNQENPSTQNNS
jgi:alpha-tubulin suppressor-like RCC1 family protein